MRPLTRMLALGACVGSICASPAAAVAPPPIKHVFVVVLENKGFSETFGNASPAPYLAKTLSAQGQLLANYYGVAHESLPNYIAMISGQAANPQTQADCQLYTDFSPGTPTSDGQVIGQGCVYPASVKTLADQLTSRGLSWRGYMEDMGNPAGQPTKTCRHPAIGTQDPTQSAHAGDQYAVRHNPFVYFHSIIDNPKLCNANDVPLDRLPGDLASESTTPNFVFVTPNLCNDGHDKTCVDGRPGGLTAADGFLRTWVPRITSSPAYQQSGLLIVAFDEAPAPPSESSGTDGSACPSPCQSPSGPNTPNPAGPMPGAGGGLVGAVALSPWVRPGSVNARPYNHYGLLRSIEDVFGLSHLGYAGVFGQTAFGDDVYNGPGPGEPPLTGPACAEQALPRPRRGHYRRGALIASAKVRRRHGRARLELAFRHRASLDVRRRQRVRGRTRTRRVGPHRVRACRIYRTTLSSGHGQVTIAARSGSGVESRTVRF